MFAPGQDIYSTVLNNDYEKASGTSMAAPHVTGVAALLLSKYPNLTAAQLKSIILDNVDKRDNLADYCVSGGILNAYKALKSQVHTHNYNSDYVWINTRQHNATCECGETSVEGHAVSAGENVWLGQYKTCLLCGGRAEYGYVIWEPTNEAIVYITDNGSFILPNGVVVLVDSDIQAYIDGTLKFHDKNTEIQ